MQLVSKRESILLLAGDIVFLLISLWLTLAIRFFSYPTLGLFLKHIIPFGIIFAIWIFVFFIADLYKKQTLFVKRKLPKTLLNTQVINSVIAVFFFYLVPYFKITPKTILFINLIISVILISIWRIYIVDIVYGQKKDNALLLGAGKEIDEMAEEINNNIKYNLNVFKISPTESSKIKTLISEYNIKTVILNLRSHDTTDVASKLYGLLFTQVKFIDIHNLYEDIFEKAPLALLGDNWFLEHVSGEPKRVYDFAKRMMDIVLAIFLGLISLIFYPFVYIGIKLDDGGDIFTFQERVGMSGRIIHLVKFRTMTANDGGKWNHKNKNRVTKFGNILRISRIDEFPQLLNVFRGDISLIGPRPEFASATEIYSREIPYYNMRYIIKPGLSGWAQIHHDAHPHHKTDIVETKNKLSYDLYYVKNRSFIVDITIAIKTIKTLFSRSGV